MRPNNVDVLQNHEMMTILMMISFLDDEDEVEVEKIDLSVPDGVSH